MRLLTQAVHIVTRYFEATQPYIKNGELSVRWVIVSMTSPASKNYAYNILSTSNPLQALINYEKSFIYGNENKSVKLLQPPKKNILDMMNNNNTIASNHITSVPYIVYNNQQGLARMIGGKNIPLTSALSAQKINEEKISELLALIGSTWSNIKS